MLFLWEKHENENIVPIRSPVLENRGTLAVKKDCHRSTDRETNAEVLYQDNFTFWMAVQMNIVS